MQMKEPLKIAFTDFWPGFEWRETEPFRFLSEHYEFEESNKPELLICSAFGAEHLRYKCHKLFFTGECVKPPWPVIDYAFSFEETNGRNLQLPQFSWDSYLFWRPKKHRIDLASYRNQEKTKFCNFIYSNQAAHERKNFCQQLTNYKHVDCPGQVLNNMPANGLWRRWRKEPRKHAAVRKLDVIQDYKFTIAFENQSSLNYTTEKILNPCWLAPFQSIGGTQRRQIISIQHASLTVTTIPILMV